MNQLFSSISPFWAMLNAVARPVLSRSAEKFPVPVISVGNIVAGGVGKTEVAIAIARYAAGKGKKVVVASRGYGSEWSDQGGVALDFESARSLRFPDEALVVLSKVPGVRVAVGKDRVGVLKKHWEELQPDLIILDDGYQHFAIKRDLDVIVHDFSVRWPVLRDLPSNFYKARVRVCLSNVPSLWQKIDWVKARYRIQSTLPKQAFLFAGIGNPQRFKKSVTDAGVQVMGQKWFRDHHPYTQENARALVAKAGNSPLLTTRKDYVKLSTLVESQGGVAGFNPHVADIDLELSENAELLWRAVDELIRER